MSVLLRISVSILVLSLINSCDRIDEQTKETIKYDNLDGDWRVSHAEVLNVDKGLGYLESLKGSEALAKSYKYRFRPNNRFERGQPETFTPTTEEMHGTYQVDETNRKIWWYLEWKNKDRVDTISFDLIEANPYKIVFIEKNGVFEVLTILNRDKIGS